MKNFEDSDIEKVVSVIKNFMDFNPENYKVKPLVRRIRSRMRKLGMNDCNNYAELLRNSMDEKNMLKQTLTINLNSFVQKIEEGSKSLEELSSAFEEIKEFN
ncbi:MAG: hypothetical protein P8Z50_04405, partial [candidate division WOR-3 bacterium]